MRVLGFDLETDKEGKNILNAGAVFAKISFPSSILNLKEGLKNNQFSSNFLPSEKISKLFDLIQISDLIIGHNIIDHDLLILKNKYPATTEKTLRNKVIIDTLYLSPITFPKNPYHNLYKESYKPYPLSKNDPVQDANLSVNLFIDELKSIENIKPEIRNILLSLLFLFPKTQYLPLLLTNFDHQLFIPFKKVELFEAIQTHYAQDLCINHFKNISNKQAKIGEFYYALAVMLSWIHFKDAYSAIGRWPKEVSPVEELIREIRESVCNDTNCAYCSSINYEVKLNNYFGFSSFRGKQKEMIHKIVLKESVIGVMPTGSGKSLTYQLPALIDAEKTKSMTIVIEPLVALTQDQVNILKSRYQIPNVEYISSLQNIQERKDVFDKARQGETDILFISPEQLRNKSTVELLKSRTIARWVIDEAHCISVWGHDFRTDYTYLPKAIKSITQNKVPITCLTATAKVEVIDEIITSFSICSPKPFHLITSDERRENLSLVVEKVSENEKKPRILSFISDINESVIIYVETRKKAEEYAEFLKAHNLNADFYHAGLLPQDRKEKQNDFLEEKTKIIVATSAFGMGIDKPNIRSILVVDMPDSLESYIQEIGRAGRDGKPATTILIYNEESISSQYLRILLNKIEPKDLVQIYSILKKRAINAESEYLQLTSGEIIHDETYEGSIDINDWQYDNKTKTAIHFLENQDTIERGLNATKLVPINLLVNPATAIKMINSNTSLSQASKTIVSYIINNVSYEDADELKQVKGVNTDHLMVSLGVERPLIWKALETLRLMKIIDYEMNLVVGLRKKKVNEIEAEVRSLLEDILLCFNYLFSRGDEIVTVITEDVLEFIEGKKGEKIANQNRIYELLGGLSSLSLIKFRKKTKNVFEITLIKDEAHSNLNIKMEIYSKIITIITSFLISKYIELQDLSPKNKEITIPLTELTNLLNKELIEIDDITYIDNSVRFLSFHQFVDLFSVPGVFAPLMNLRVNVKVDTRSVHGRDLKEFYREKFYKLRVIEQYALAIIESFIHLKPDEFINDYFQLTKNSFIKKYLEHVKGILFKPIPYNIEKSISIDYNMLTDEQKQIVNSTEDAIMVLAGPGSGKTKILVHKIASLVTEEGVNPETILALVYNRSAQQEIKKRLFYLLGKMTSAISVHTFHSFALAEICNVNINEIYKSDNKEAFFKDLLKRAAKYLQENDNDDKVNFPFKYILIDEYQDINKDQYEIISSLVGKLKNKEERLYIFAIGDDDQSIYEFSGADTKFIKQFQEEYSASVKGLTINHRSSPKIVNFSNKIIEINPGRLKSGFILKSSNKDTLYQSSEKIYYHSPSSKREEALIILERLKNHSHKTIGILGRINEDLSYLKWLLKEKGILFRNLGARRRGYLSLSFWVLKKLLENYPHDIFNKELLKEKILNKFNNLGLNTHFLNESSIFIDNIYFEEGLGINKTLTGQEILKDLFRYQFEPTTVDTQSNSEKGIHKIFVDTIHKSKGTEFDIVIIPSSDSGILSDKEPEERRLLYVACTRAKTELLIFQGSWQEKLTNDHIKTMGERLSVKFIDEKKLPKKIKTIELDPSHIHISYLKFNPDKYYIPPEIANLSPQTNLKLIAEGNEIFLVNNSIKVARLSKKGVEEVVNFQQNLNKVRVDNFDIRVRESEENTSFIMLPSLSVLE